MDTPANTRRRFQQLLIGLPLVPLASATAWFPTTAQAHGEKHDGHTKAGPVVKEQKPWGIAAENREAKRTVEIRMTDDMKFTPSHLEVREGETLRLRAVNRGRVMHEIVIGTREELVAHAEMMKKHPGMEHDEPYMAHVSPGKRGDIVWTFNRAGDFEFACLIPGHFEAGMRGTVRVRPA
ncbi:MAG: cupredoxin family protein [Hydrogenophaga sp.]|uniref:cupredoxin domain-containing protein n=1 Tax=Hydrogenophaga sp. TaxID=1904254 RepID=UPI00272912ED|nr:cupredoxin family protein [Hydrogenophaga sp.]MDO9146630.1 cupredoxin family protein [Hydrogenophaga sp.]MDO9606034.1 cupredoxin family protein [Hydrogenophaga sp.]MDP3475862.1 cupredoxin family protein [Hydrogenophaga sp.]